MMDFTEKVVLVSGANGGIGAALVRALLDRGAAKVYAGARSLFALDGVVMQDPERVVPLALDITAPASVAAAAEQCADVEVLINNAGVNRCVGLLAPQALDAARLEMEVNFFGTLAMCREFSPAMAIRGAGVIANVCSIIGLVNLPVNGTYCASKAAGHSLLQGVRAELSPLGIQVVGIYPGPVATRMTEGQEMPKVTAEQVADAILDGIEKGEEDIFPDPMSREVHRNLLDNPKQVEHSFAAMIPSAED
ncbi:MAG: SDR family oxidoreductase [Pelovirga sp.]|jgi:NAD(P)-dependent dehydrogenase (short-subunit alcohol dehydrogenase family)